MYGGDHARAQVAEVGVASLSVPVEAEDGVDVRRAVRGDGLLIGLVSGCPCRGRDGLLVDAAAVLTWTFPEGIGC